MDYGNTKITQHALKLKVSDSESSECVVFTIWKKELNCMLHSYTMCVWIRIWIYTLQDPALINITLDNVCVCVCVCVSSPIYSLNSAVRLWMWLWCCPVDTETDVCSSSDYQWSQNTFFKLVWRLSIRWQKWFTETGQTISVTGQMHGCLCYYYLELY